MAMNLDSDSAVEWLGWWAIAKLILYCVFLIVPAKLAWHEWRTKRKARRDTRAVR